MEICIVMLGCKGLTSLGRSNYTIVITGFKALTTHLNLTLVFMVYLVSSTPPLEFGYTFFAILSESVHYFQILS